MTQAELFAYTFYLTAAALAAAACIVGLGLLLQVERHFGRWFARAVVPGMALAVAASSLLSGRDLKYASISIESIGDVGGGNAAVSWTLRLLTVGLVGFGLAVALGRAFDRSRGVRQAGVGLALAFVVYYFFNSIANSVFGTVPAFTHHSVYALIVFWAVYAARDEPVEGFVDGVKVALWMLVVLSLVAAAVKPSVAVQPEYRGWLPGLKFRLWGVGSNPNSIGPIALLLLLMEAMQPTRQRILRWVGIACALVVLLLAQSKTAWAAGIVVAGVLIVYRHAAAPQGGVRIGFVLAALAMMSIVVLTVMFGAADRVIDKLSRSQVGTDVSTLTGRLQIWAAAIAAWRDNPFFGYGPSAWGPAHRLAIGLPFAFSAHNQFLQSLSVSGGLGLVSLTIYFGWLATHAWRAAGRTRGVSLALLVLVGIRCMTEAPFSVNTLFNGDTITQLVLFRLALIGIPVQSPRVATVGMRLPATART